MFILFRTFLVWTMLKRSRLKPGENGRDLNHTKKSGHTIFKVTWKKPMIQKRMILTKFSKISVLRKRFYENKIS